MGFLRSSKPDPIAERTRALNEEIAALEAQIRDLGTQVAEDDAGRGQGETARTAEGAEPVFEPVNHLPASAEDQVRQAGALHYNELGVRKYDLVGAWRQLQRHFRGPAASNPRLISYLAAGSIQGLRPLRYESRVARNRVIALSLLLFLVLWGLITLLRGR